MTDIERRIFAAIRDAAREGLVPKSLYLTPDDRAQLREAMDTEPGICAGLPVRGLSARGQSKIYCRHGIARALPKRDVRR